MILPTLTFTYLRLLLVRMAMIYGSALRGFVPRFVGFVKGFFPIVGQLSGNRRAIVRFF